MTGKTLEENEIFAKRYDRAADLLELRVDFLQKPDIPEIINFSRLIEKPLILTCRRERDGGKYRRTDRTRAVQLLKLLEEGNWAYVDLEEDFRRSELEQVAKDRGIEIIRSFHDMDKVPADLFSRIEKIAKRGEIPKAAVTARGIRDVLTIFSAEKQLAHIEKKVILSMGDWGIPTRILYKRTGSMFTFASPMGTSGASGHLSLDAMKDLYRADQVDAGTKIFGVIGNPVMHTASPRIHNPAYHKLGINAVYLPFQVDDVRSFFVLADLLGVQGFSVTVPHKQQVLPYLGKISREVKLIGSCNTVVWERECWKGINTDYYGFLRPIMKDLDDGKIRKAAVIGAGGAARSVVWALRNHQCSVTILNRTPDKAMKLAQETGSSWGSLEESDKAGGSDIIVQTTNVGMSPDVQGDPLEKYTFRGNEILYELVYTPETTCIMERARKAGCRLIPGKRMLLGQGVMQFETFTGLTYPFSEDTVVF